MLGRHHHILHEHYLLCVVEIHSQFVEVSAITNSKTQISSLCHWKGFCFLPPIGLFLAVFPSVRGTFLANYVVPASLCDPVVARTPISMTTMPNHIEKKIIVAALPNWCWKEPIHHFGTQMGEIRESMDCLAQRESYRIRYCL